MIVYAVFGSAETQPWAKDDVTQEGEEEQQFPSVLNT
jgi:hypothetical protein